MIIKLDEKRKQLAEAEKIRKRIARRYLRDVSVVLPCCLQQKHEILKNLRALILNHPHPLADRAELEKAIGAPEEIARAYIGGDTVHLLRRSVRKRRIAVFSAFLLLLVCSFLLRIFLSSPMTHYTESIEILENETESVIIQNPYSADPIDLALPRRGTKTVTCCDHRGTKLWTVTVTGTFGYLYGDTSQAIETDCTLTVYADNGLSVRKENYLFANAAVATVTMEHDGQTLQKKVMLSCDQYGNLS